MTTLTSLALALLLVQGPAGSAAGEAASAPSAEAGAPPAAAPPSGAARIIPLDEALRLADERNLDLRAAAARLRQASVATRRAWAGYLPSVTASGSYTRNEEEAAIPAGVLGPDEIVIQKQDQLAGQVEATQVLFSPSLWSAIRAASRGVEAAQLSTEEVRRDILFGTAQAYYGVASLRQSVEVAQRLLEIAQRQEKDARVRYQAGTIAKVALLRAEIDRARAEQDLRRAQNSYQSARIGLAQLLDLPADFEVEDPPEPGLPPDLAGLEEAALRERADVLAARRDAEAARAARQAQLGRYWPDVSAFGRWQIQNSAGFTGQEHQWAAGIAAQWRIYDGGLREADLAAATARVDEAEATVASLESRARAEVRQALLDLESARANAAKAREQRALAAENQRLVDVAFRAGAATAIEQADATAELRTAEIAQTTEALAAQLAALRVLRAAGMALR